MNEVQHLDTGRYDKLPPCLKVHFGDLRLKTLYQRSIFWKLLKILAMKLCAAAEATFELIVMGIA